MKLMILISLLALPALVRADETDDKQYAQDLIGVQSWSWHRDGFDTVMMADFVITNSSPWTVKDIEITCHHSSASGTEIDQNSRTVYDTFPPFSRKVVRNFNMGFIDSQAASSAASVDDFTFTGPHPSLEEIKNAAADIASAAATNAAAKELKELNAAAAGRAKALALDMSLAGTNDADGLFRMGRRYLHGDGVEKDAAKARDYFGRAAAAGNETAKAELASLPQ